MNNWIVYKHTFPNGKCYIGITSKTPNQRWGLNGQYYREDQPLIHYAINKYKWENVKHEILFENLTKEQAFEKEEELIAYYHSFYLDPNGPGYNMTKGGEGSKTLYDPRIEELWKEGKTCTEIEKILKHDKTCIAAYLRALGYEVLPYKKAINQFDLDGNYIQTFKSAREAERQTGIDYRLISGCLNRKAVQTNNYQWRYYNEEDLKGIKSAEEYIKEHHQKKCCKVAQLDKDTLEIVNIFNSLTEAEKNVPKTSHSSIRKVINGKLQTSGGYKWVELKSN